MYFPCILLSNKMQKQMQLERVKEFVPSSITSLKKGDEIIVDRTDNGLKTAIVDKVETKIIPEQNIGTHFLGAHFETTVSATSMTPLRSQIKFSERIVLKETKYE